MTVKKMNTEKKPARHTKELKEMLEAGFTIDSNVSQYIYRALCENNCKIEDLECQDVHDIYDLVTKEKSSLFDAVDVDVPKVITAAVAMSSVIVPEFTAFMSEAHKGSDFQFYISEELKVLGDAVFSATNLAIHDLEKVSGEGDLDTAGGRLDLLVSSVIRNASKPLALASDICRLAPYLGLEYDEDQAVECKYSLAYKVLGTIDNWADCTAFGNFKNMLKTYMRLLRAEVLDRNLKNTIGNNGVMSFSQCTSPSRLNMSMPHDSGTPHVSEIPDIEATVEVTPDISFAPKQRPVGNYSLISHCGVDDNSPTVDEDVAQLLEIARRVNARGSMKYPAEIVDACQDIIRGEANRRLADIGLSLQDGRVRPSANFDLISY